MIQVIRRELRRMATQPLYWLSMVVFPLMATLFFTTLMGEGLPEQLPLGVVDEDHTSTSRSIVRNLSAFQSTATHIAYANPTEARKAMQRGEIYGYYLIPRGTSREAQLQRVPTVSFYTNYSYLVAGSLLYRDMRMMSELASGAAACTVLYAHGATERMAMAYLQPIVIDMHATGNPWINYNVYLTNSLVPGVFGIFLFMIPIYSLGTELKWGTSGELLRTARGHISHAVLGKLLPQAIVFLLVGTVIVLWLYGYLRFPCHGGILSMWIVMCLYVLACMGWGVFLFTMVPTLRLGLSFASLWGVLSFSICGMSFPVMAMHPVLQGLAWFFPLRHYFILYVNSALDGYPLLNAWPYVACLLCFALLLPLCLPRLRTVLERYCYVA